MERGQDDKIEQIAKTELGPNDVVVITVQDSLTLIQVENLAQRVRDVLHRPCIILPGGAEMSVACPVDNSASS